MSSGAVSPGNAVEVCAACGSALSVAERMFYFFEGEGTPPSCRVCMAVADSERPVHDIEAPAIGLATIAEASRAWPLQEAADTQTLLCRAIRAYLQEACDWSARTLDQLEHGTPFARSSHDVDDEARRELVRDQLFEAVLAMDAQRRKVGRLARLTERPSRSFVPSDETSYGSAMDRVSVRAAGMTLPARSAGRADEAPPLLTVQAEARARRPAHS
jgi:hypothetical protein